MKTLFVRSIVALLLCTPVIVGAQGRYVVVNGQQVGPAGLRQLDAASCVRVPNGRYWIDRRTAIWGYEGGLAQGRVGDNCRQSRRKSLSERGLLYSPGELLR